MTDDELLKLCEHIISYGTPVAGFVRPPTDEEMVLARALKSRLREGWISVEDRLPELQQPVALVNVDKYENTEGVWDRHIYDCGYLNYFGHNYWSIRGERAQGIGTYTHWAPLPEPPKD